MSQPGHVRSYLHADTGLLTSYNTVTYFSINFINVLSNYRCIRYLVFPALLRVSLWYLLTIRVLHLSQNIVNL